MAPSSSSKGPVAAVASSAERGMGQAGESLGARRSERTSGSPAGLRCQLGRALKEGSGRGEAATCLRTAGR